MVSDKENGKSKKVLIIVLIDLVIVIGLVVAMLIIFFNKDDNLLDNYLEYCPEITLEEGIKSASKNGVKAEYRELDGVKTVVINYPKETLVANIIIKDGLINFDTVYLSSVDLFATSSFYINVINENLCKKGNNEEIPIIEKTPVIEDEIKTDDYYYVLYDDKTDLYKKYFNQLKNELLKKNVDDEEYASIVTKLFVTDFYSLINKMSNNDVGGVFFIHETIRDKFILKASDTLYKYVWSNISEGRRKDLPEVSNVEIKEIVQKPIEFNDINDPNGYEILVDVSYVKDTGYPKTVELMLIHDNKKLYIVSVK